MYATLSQWGQLVSAVASGVVVRLGELPRREDHVDRAQDVVHSTTGGEFVVEAPRKEGITLNSRLM